MVVSFASIRRAHPEAPLWLCVNEEIAEPFRTELEDIGVEFRYCEPIFQSNPTVTQSHPGCLYLMDTIRMLSQATLPEEVGAVVFIDPDTITRRSLARLVAQVADARLVSYDISEDADIVSNGQSRQSLSAGLSHSSNFSSPEAIRLYGGEFLAVHPGTLASLHLGVQHFWDWFLLEGSDSIGAALTDEHLVSVAIASLGLTPGEGRDWIKRIWNHPSWCNVDGTEQGIPIWHLPAEKKTGLRRLYSRWRREGGFNHLNDHEFGQLLDSEIRLPGPAGPSRGQRIYRQARRKVRSLVK